jgi:hypothetical protein
MLFELWSEGKVRPCQLNSIGFAKCSAKGFHLRHTLRLARKLLNGSVWQFLEYSAVHSRPLWSAQVFQQFPLFSIGLFVGLRVDGNFLDGEGTISGKLITRVESANAFTCSKNSLFFRGVWGVGPVPPVIFDETLQLHYNITDTFKLGVNMPYKSDSLEERFWFFAYLLYPCSPALEVLYRLDQPLPLLDLPHPVLLILAVMPAGMVYSLAQLRLSSQTGQVFKQTLVNALDSSSHWFLVLPQE